MKKQYTEFICDECKKEKLVEEKYGFPYIDNWFYLHNFNFKSFTKIDINITEKREKHFCSKNCMLSYITKLLK